MQSLKKHIVDRLMTSGITSTALDVFMYLIRYQDDTGTTRVYYQDVCNSMKISPPSFYAAKRWLEKEQFITSSKERENDPIHIITISGNDFTFYPENYESLTNEEKEEWRYLSLDKPVFHDKQFLGIRVHEKLMIIQWMLNNNNQSYHITTIYEKFQKLFKVGRRAVCNYIHTIKTKFKKYINIYLKNGKYHVRLKTIEYKGSVNQTEEYRCNLVRSLVNRHKIKIFTKKKYKNLSKKEEEHFKDRTIKDVSGLFKTYQKSVLARHPQLSKKDFYEFLLNLIEDAMKICLIRDNRGLPKRQWERRMLPNQIHAILREKLKALGIIHDDTVEVNFDFETA